MKIKKTRHVRLDELMKYVWDNNITRTRFEGKDCSIYVDDRGNFKVADEYSLCKSDLYTFTEEVEITEDMRLNLVVIDDECEATTNHYTKISQILKEADTYGYDIKAMYLQNNDGKIGELIWEDGEMID